VRNYLPLSHNTVLWSSMIESLLNSVMKPFVVNPSQCDDMELLGLISIDGQGFFVCK